MAHKCWRAGKGPPKQTAYFAVLLRDLGQFPAHARGDVRATGHSPADGLPWEVWFGALRIMFMVGSGRASLRAGPVCDIHPGVPSSKGGIWHVAGTYTFFMGGWVGGWRESFIVTHCLGCLRPRGEGYSQAHPRQAVSTRPTGGKHVGHPRNKGFCAGCPKCYQNWAAGEGHCRCRR